MHEARVAGPCRTGTNADPLGGGPAHVVHQDVGPLDQTPEHLLAGRRLQVEAHAALVSTYGHEERTEYAGGRRPDTANDVASGRFHFDDVGAEIAQQQRGVEARRRPW